MLPDRDVEFVIDLLPGTTHISKRPYRLYIEELVPHLGECRSCSLRRRMVPRGCVLIIGLLMMSPLKIKIPYRVLKICLIK
jgi:hypothetical protein